MAAIRCLKCGTPITGTAQMCPSCTEEKNQVEAFTRQAAVEATTMNCPSCSATVQRSANFCPKCGRNFVAPMQTYATTVQRGDFGVRFIAALIDGVITAVPTVAVELAIPNAFGYLLGFLIGISYTVGFWTATGATPGKMALGLRVVDMNNQPVTFGRALGRYFAMFLSGITLGIGYLMILGDQKLGLHDRVAGTQVVYANTLPAPEPTAPTEASPAV
jgi:uncharacterized RDD family membrane protein YckC